MRTLAFIVACLCCGYVSSRQQTVWTSLSSETPVSLNPNRDAQRQTDTTQTQTEQVPGQPVIQPQTQFPIRQHIEPSPSIQLRQAIPRLAHLQPTYMRVPVRPAYLTDGYLRQPTYQGLNFAYPYLKFPQRNPDSFGKLNMHNLLSEYTRAFKTGNMVATPYGQN